MWHAYPRCLGRWEEGLSSNCAPASLVLMKSHLGCKGNCVLFISCASSPPLATYEPGSCPWHQSGLHDADPERCGALPCNSVDWLHVPWQVFCLTLHIMTSFDPLSFLFQPGASLIALDSSSSEKDFLSQNIVQRDNFQANAVCESTTALTHRVTLNSANQCCLCWEAGRKCTGRGGVKHSLTCQITSSHECIMQGSASEKAVWLSLLHHHADDELVILHITICIFPYASYGSFRPDVPDCWLVSLHGLPRTWQPFNSFALCCVFSLGTICSVTAALLFFPLAGRHNNPGHKLL